MAPRRWSAIAAHHQRSRSSSICRIPSVALLTTAVLVPLIFLAVRVTHYSSTPSTANKDLPDGSTNGGISEKKLNVLEQIETLFPEDVIESIKSKVDDSGPLSLNVIGRKDLSSSWVLEKPVDVSNSEVLSALKEPEGLPKGFLLPQIVHHTDSGEQSNYTSLEENNNATDVTESQEKETDPGFSYQVNETARILRRQLRLARKEKRLTELTREDGATRAMLEEEVLRKKKEIDRSIFSKYSIWKHDNDEYSDYLVRLIRDQLIMARVYTSLAQSRGNAQLLRELRQRTKESQHALGEATVDAHLPRSASEKIKLMGQAITTAREQLFECTAVTKKLRAMVQLAEEQGRVLKKQSTFLSQLAAKTIPKGLHCLALRLTIEYNLLPKAEKDFPGQEKLEDNNLYHYALFSDNVLAASVVVNSTVRNAKEPEKHVFHLVTDKLNYGAMRMWFLANPPVPATIEVQNIDDLKWLNSSYCPVLRQLESAAMKEYYFKADHPTTLASGAANLKYRNPKYLSMLNHLRFYLPEVYPRLHRILFLDDDIVVQKDLAPLWLVDLGGNVNGAVETCGESFHRFDKYLNFSNPLIVSNFDPHACGWAYGMNMFDLQEWKKRDITGIYHKWQDLNEDRNLWKLGTLPPGLITFYNMTHALDKSWHVLGLGYNPSVESKEIEGASVIHYNGNMKPWLELAMTRYKPYWTRYVNYDHLFLQQCNIA